MNILEVEDIIKGLPDQALQKEAQAPSGQVPQFLVVSEIQRRTDMRKRFQSQGQEQPQGTVSQQIVQEGIASLAPPPQQQQMMPQQPMPPQQAMPPQQPMPMQQNPMGQPLAQPMYRGGVVEMQEGRQATLGLPDDEEDKKRYGLSISEAANNPMSVRQSNQDWEGETGTYSSKDSGDFVEYGSPEYSFRAADRILRTGNRKYGADTLAKALTRYAPPKGDAGYKNPTQQYIDYVSQQSGIDPDEPLDFEDPVTRSRLVSPMAFFESNTVLTPDQVRDTISSVDKEYAATLPERDIPFMSPEVKAGIQVPTEGFPVPDVQTEDPRLNIPFINVGPEGGQRKREFVDVESTEALLDAITRGKPFSQGQGRERQGSVSRFPTKDRQAGEFTKAIAGAIEADAKRTNEKDTQDPDQIKAVESFTAGSTGVPIIVDKGVRKSDEDLFAGSRRAEELLASMSGPKKASQSYMPDLLGQIEKEKDSYRKKQYMPDPLGQFDSERLAALVDSVGEGATRKEFMAGMTKPYMPDPLGQFDAERAAALVDSVGKGATRKEYMPDPLAQFKAERAELEEAEPSFLRKEMKKAPLGSYIDRYLQIMEAGRNPETEGYDSKKAQSKAKELMIESGEEVYSGPSEPDPNKEPGWKKALRYLTPDLDKTEAAIRNMKKSDQTDEPYVPGVDIDAVTRQLKKTEAEKGTLDAGLETTTTTPPETTPRGSAATPSAGATSSGGMYDLMREIAGTREEAKKEAFANAMIQLGAGVASGNLAAGLSAAGKAASETMSDYKDRALKGRMAELQLKKADEQIAYRRRQEELYSGQEERRKTTEAQRAYAARRKELQSEVLKQLALRGEYTKEDLTAAMTRAERNLIADIARSYAVPESSLGAISVEEGSAAGEEASLPPPEYQTDPSGIKFIGVN